MAEVLLSSEIVNPMAASFLDNSSFLQAAGSFIGRKFTSGYTDMTEDQPFDLEENMKAVPDDFDDEQKNNLRLTSTPGEFQDLYSQYAIHNSAKYFADSNPVSSFAINAFSSAPEAIAVPLGVGAKAGLTGLEAVGSAAVRGAAGNAVEGAVTEAGFHALTDTRTMDDSYISVALQTVLGGAIGGGVKYYSEFLKGTGLGRGVADVFTQKTNAPVDTTPLPLEVTATSSPSPASFDMAIGDWKQDGEFSAQATRFLTGERLPGFSNSYVTATNSLSPTARKTAYDFLVAGNPLKDGQVADSRTLLNARDIKINPALSGYNNEYKSALRGFKETGGDSKMFDEMVHRYVVTGETDNAAVRQLGDQFMERVKNAYEPYLDALVKSGRVSPEVVDNIKAQGPRYAAGYVTRIYNVNKIDQNPEAFERFLGQALGDTNPKLIAEKLDYNAKLIRERIMNVPSARAAGEDSLEAYTIKGLANRNLGLPDATLLDSGFMVSDTREMMKNVYHKYTPDTLLYDKYGSANPDEIFGTVGRKKQVVTDAGDVKLEVSQGSIRDEYDELRKAVRESGKSEKEIDSAIKQLNTREQSDIKALQFMFDDFRYKTGMFSASDNNVYSNKYEQGLRRAVKFTQGLANTSFLRNAVLRDAVQFGQNAMFERIDRVYGVTYRKLATAVREALPIGKKLSIAEKSDLMAAGVGMHTAMDRVNYTAGADLAASRQSGVENALQKVSAFSRRSILMDGSSVTKDMMENGGFSIFSNRALRVIDSAGGDVSKIKDADLKFLRGYGLSDKDIPKIAQSFLEHGEKEKVFAMDYHLPNYSQWGDKELADKFMNAGLNYARGISGDTTFQSNYWLRNTVSGNVFGSLTGFMNAVIGRVMIPAVQQNKSLFAFGLVSMVGHDMASRMVGDFIRYGEIAEDENDMYKRYVAPSINNVLSFRMGDLFNRAYYGLGQPTMSDAYTGDLAGPFGFQPESFVGAPASYATSVGRAAIGAYDLAVSETPKSKSLYDVRQVLPFKNLLGFNMIMDEVENGIRDTYDLPLKAGSGGVSLNEKLSEDD